MVDYHVHTRLCGHARGSVEEYVEAALRQGLREICFTDHIPLPGFGRGLPGLRMNARDTERYFASLERARTAYREITILTGIEADYYEGCEEYLRRFLGRYPLDLVLMSVHFLRGWPEPYWVFDPPPLPVQQLYSEYFAELRKGIQTGLFDSVAHLDLVKLPGAPALRSNAEDVRQVLALCRERGMSLEINTSGARKAIAETYPAPEITALAAREGTALITGSDAHDPDQVGFLFTHLQAFLRELPGARLVGYRGRKAIPARSRATG